MKTKVSAALRNKVEEFEGFVDRAFTQKYSGWPEEIRNGILQFNSVKRWNLLEFLDTYSNAPTYPRQRLERLIYHLFDIKLQLYYILEVDLGLYNLLVHDRGYNEKDPVEIPHTLLTRFSLDQSLIGKSRVLWERIMNFIYYLETGEDIEKKVSRRSKRSLFFNFVASSPRWRFLEPYGPLLEGYDDAFRTPEYHKSSVLRAELLGSRKVDPNELLKLVNNAINNLWDNILSIVKIECSIRETDSKRDKGIVYISSHFSGGIKPGDSRSGTVKVNLRAAKAADIKCQDIPRPLVLK